jgi:hypothetical protein
MTKISIIIPVHEFNDDVKSYLSKSLTSVKLQQEVKDEVEVVVVYNALAREQGLLDFVTDYTTTIQLETKTILNEGKSDFCSQINFGVKSIETPHFTILEYDDELSSIHIKNALKHISELPDVGIFLPFTIEVDASTGNAIQIVNQSVWSKGYVGENGVLGYLNTRSLNDFSFYTLGGAVINKSEYEACGGLKSNIVLAFTYEFLLRFLENGNKIYSIAKFGYKHTINRSGALFTGFAATMPMNERKFWFETAKKECHFNTDRVINTKSLVRVVTE